MNSINRRTAIKLIAAGAGGLSFKPGSLLAQDAPQPFSAAFRKLESLTTGEWWKVAAAASGQKNPRGGQPSPPAMDVSRDEVICFACYTQQSGLLKGRAADVDQRRF